MLSLRQFNNFVRFKFAYCHFENKFEKDNIRQVQKYCAIQYWVSLSDRRSRKELFKALQAMRYAWVDESFDSSEINSINYGKLYKIYLIDDC